MYVREEATRGHTHLYLVESEREGGRVRQRIIRALGRMSDMEAGRIACTRIGGRLLCGRL